MLRIASDTTPINGTGWPLFDTATTRQIEQDCTRQLPAHTLMQRAGLAVARLAMAIAPHAQRIWIACGPGNNGGDGFEAAAQLKTLRPLTQILVSETRNHQNLPADAKASWLRARAAGVQWTEQCPEHMGAQDLCIDALLGIGLQSKNTAKLNIDQSRLLQLLQQVQRSSCPVLCVDIASGLNADTGQYLPEFTPTAAPEHEPSPHHTLALLTLQPGLFTAQGRDACGQVWWDDLGCNAPGTPTPAPIPAARLSTRTSADSQPARPHASHKGSFGDVAILGGEGLGHQGLSMTGAAWLAALAALYAGAGRVMLALLDAEHRTDQAIAPWPEIMLRQPQAQDWHNATVVCGCGGGQAIETWLPTVLQQAPRLVLDADALNAISQSASLTKMLSSRATRQQSTILTPHPLEAARLLQTDTQSVQAHRLRAASALAQQFQCTALLKGSGTVIASPASTPWINSSGNALLARGGTGDVLAGLTGAIWAVGCTAEQAAVQAAFRHGRLADEWPAHTPFSASALAMRLG
ncbi:MAG: NAD(P)H-hydrate dehydratase [Comamonas sp.]|jgi:hydroxyethylthiazole kinase-like uncharacterized protein yjeF|uniref:NAD(P)H-hydrate dehydratase n=1 Tax=Comamonas sp. TaxID=34028 RepID=UPI002833EDB1|nr:NAD(P)H-hydrate dehydratase [Comamonas sp.]MDR0214996.1 NAD(P)H-hydrate dehydratase [Comamonas sp.]